LSSRRERSADEISPAPHAASAACISAFARRFEYLARNTKKVAGMALENDLNKHGRDGWEAVCVAQDYLIFKRGSRGLKPSWCGPGDASTTASGPHPA